MEVSFVPSFNTMVNGAIPPVMATVRLALPAAQMAVEEPDLDSTAAVEDTQVPTKSSFNGMADTDSIETVLLLASFTLLAYNFQLSPL